MSESRTPEEIRAEIEDSREQLGATAAALADKAAEKADVKGQAKAKVDEVKAQATGRVQELRERAASATPSSAGHAAGQVSATAKERPLPFAAAGAFVAGLLLGRITARRG